MATLSVIDSMLRPSFKASSSDYPDNSCFFPWRRAWVAVSKKAHATLLVVHRKEGYICDRCAIESVCPRLQKVLQPLVILIHPWHREEVGVVDSPVGWRRCYCGVLLRHRRRERSYGRVSTSVDDILSWCSSGGR